MMIPIFWINPDDVGFYWEAVRPLIEKAMVRTGVDKSYDSDFVRIQVAAGRWQCWVGIGDDDKVKVAHITFIDVLPKRKVFSIPLTGAETGTIDSWIDHIEIFRQFAKEHSCSAIRGWGRKGWERKLAVKPTDVRIEFDIEV